MEIHGLKKIFAIGVLIYFILTGVYLAKESPVAAPRNVEPISEEDFLKLASAALLGEKKKDLIGLGVSARGLTVVSVDLAGDDWKKFINSHVGLINALADGGIFVADKNWRVLNGLRFQEFGNRSYMSLYGVVFEIDNSKENDVPKHMISALNLTEKKFRDVTATLLNKDKSISLTTVDIYVFIRLFAVVGMNDKVTLTDARIFLKDNFGIGLSENGKVIEDVVQYLRVYNVQGQEGMMMVTGQGYNLAQVGNKWYFGKSFDLVDAKTLLTDPQYAAMAKEILTNTKLLAQSVLNVVGSWMKLYYREDLAGASKEILDLLNYDASKLPKEGVELRLENGKVDLVPRR